VSGTYKKEKTILLINKLDELDKKAEVNPLSENELDFKHAC
jgi:hypothetical protein